MPLYRSRSSPGQLQVSENLSNLELATQAATQALSGAKTFVGVTGQRLELRRVTFLGFGCFKTTNMAILDGEISSLWGNPWGKS